MQDYKDIVLSSESSQTITRAKNALNPLLPLEVRHRLNEIIIRYLHEFGLQGMFDRLNNKSIGAIMKDAESLVGSKPINSDERDGVRYDLYASNDETSASDPRDA